MRLAAWRDGPLSLSVNQSGGFVRGDVGQARANLQLYFSPVSYTQTPLAARKLLNPDPFAAFLLSHNPRRPTNRGHLELASPDPTAPPAIHPNYLGTKVDVADVLADNRLLRAIAAALPLTEVITREPIPGAQVAGNEALLEDFRARADTVYHPTSTRMMAPDAATSVVDASLKVHGVAGWRMIDTSVFPTITSGNTNAPTVMVAEKGADMVMGDARA